MPGNEQQRECYRFLQDRAQSGLEFTATELGVATGWSNTTPATYLGKQLKSLVFRVGTKFRVHRHFLYWTEDQFLRLVTQKERGLPSYRRETFQEIVTFDFLLPLSNERPLREILDNLFYLESLERILATISPVELQIHFPKEGQETQEPYLRRIATLASKLFGGYSIVHASGRFRAADLMNKRDAAELNYIVDETTAFVKFIVPCSTTRKTMHELRTNENPPEQKTLKEIESIRFLFLHVFAETVAMNILDEQEIWLIENTLGKQRLYRWIATG